MIIMLLKLQKLIHGLPMLQKDGCGPSGKLGLCHFKLLEQLASRLLIVLASEKTTMVQHNNYDYFIILYR